MFDDILFILLLMFLTACPAAVFKWFLTHLHGSCTHEHFSIDWWFFQKSWASFERNTLDSSNGDSLQTWNLQVTHQPLWCVLHLNSLEPTIRVGKVIRWLIGKISKKEKIWSEWHVSGKKCFADTRNQRVATQLRAESKSTVTQITTGCNQGMQKSIYKRTTCWSLKRMHYSSRRQHQVLFLSAQSRKLRLQFTGIIKTSCLGYIFSLCSP